MIRKNNSSFIRQSVSG